ncbi:MAG: RtcB family protein [Planctomycetota bacterium]
MKLSIEKTYTQSEPAPIRRWVGATPPDNVLASLERMRRLRDAVRVAVMPDVHLAKGVCVGTVLATRRAIYPSAVGGDIGCGIAALGFDAPASVIDSPVKGRAILKTLTRLVPISRYAKPLPLQLNDRRRLSLGRLDHALQRTGRAQLGTLGGGNHFLELQRDTADGSLWAMVHSGSRRLGQAISRHYIEVAPERSHGLPLLDADSDLGRAYLRDQHLARAYARLNRRLMLDAVAWLLREYFGIAPRPASFVQCDHNHVRRELHFGEYLYVHRKGAAPAFANQPGLIPGSMGTASYHVLGRGHREALCSSSHGAGRAMSRTEARSRISTGQFKRQTRHVHTNPNQHARLREEAPQAYKDIRQVMRHQTELVKIRRELEPVLTYKGC